jgi:hypothetical protein
LKVIWEDDALKLLMGRDRYSRQVIQDEFRRDPRQDAIEFDPEQRGFLTRVSNGRFNVVWYLDEPRQQAVVRAVVPLTNVDTSASGVEEIKALKEYVQRAVLEESKGDVVL